MRVQDKFRALISPLTIFVLFIWLITCILLYNAFLIYIKNKTYIIQCQELQSKLNILQEKSKQLKNKEISFNLKDERLSAILSLLVSASKKSDAQIGEVNIGTEMENMDNKVLPLIIVVKGTYNQIGRFINNIEREDPRLQFNDIELSTKETNGLGIICKLKGYFIIL